MKPSDKKALKLIAERYGWCSKGHGLAGQIAGDRMYEQLVSVHPSHDQIDEIANCFDSLVSTRSADDKRQVREKFLSLVLSVAKTTTKE